MAKSKFGLYWDWSWNPLGGCFPVGPGCKYCYAARLAGGQQTAHNVELYLGVTNKAKDHYVFNGNHTVLDPGNREWRRIINWPGADRPLLGPGQPSIVFIETMGDLFFEKHPPWAVDRVLVTMTASNHIGLLLTRRPERMAAYFEAVTSQRWRRKFWCGFSAERQHEFDLRWPPVRRLAERGWMTFASLAPMIAPITLPPDFLSLARWVIVSGEENAPPGRVRPMKAAWARAVRNQAIAAGLPLFVKQMDSLKPIPPDLLIWEFPNIGDQR